MAAPPFKIQGFAMCGVGSKIYVIGGVFPGFKYSNEVHIYDIKRDEWTRGPDYPVLAAYKGSGMAATVVGSNIYANGFGGGVYKLDTIENQWGETDVELKQSRIYHRLASFNDQLLLFIGGRSNRAATDSVETIDISGINIIQDNTSSEFDIEHYISTYKDSQKGSST